MTKTNSSQRSEQQDDITKIKWFHCWLCTFLLEHWKVKPTEDIHLRHVEWKRPTHLSGGQRLN